MTAHPQPQPHKTERRGPGVLAPRALRGVHLHDERLLLDPQGGAGGAQRGHRQGGSWGDEEGVFVSIYVGVVVGDQSIDVVVVVIGYLHNTTPHAYTLKHQVEIKHPPIFIVGHYRSGTSLLHELLNRDDNVRCACRLSCRNVYCIGFECMSRSMLTHAAALYTHTKTAAGAQRLPVLHPAHFPGP